MEILMDVTVTWMSHLNPEYTDSIIKILQSQPERVRAGRLKLQGEPEREFTYVDIAGVPIDKTQYIIQQ
jgi:hypothetical protein